MTKILFVCHGNICRSPMAEFVMKDMVRRAGLAEDFTIASAATSNEEIGSPVYPPARRKLWEHGIGCEGKTARRITARDYGDYDLLIGMDEANLRNMVRCFGGDPKGKLHLLLAFAGRQDSVADPWYTGDFEATWQDVNQGCLALLNRLYPEVLLDFSDCESREALYDRMAQRMLWQEDYGRNLDALYDVLTGLPHYGRRFVLRLPDKASPVYDYAGRVADVFRESGIPVTIE